MGQPFDNIESNLMTGLVEEFRRRNRPRICWSDNIAVWTDLSWTNLFRATKVGGGGVGQLWLRKAQNAAYRRKATVVQ